MAAAAMGELTGLTIEEQEYAAEIAMEHQLCLLYTSHTSPTA